MSQADGIRLTVLVEDLKNPIRPELTANHGLSFFIALKAGGHTTNLLMDTGPSADIVFQNAQKLDVDLRKAGSVVLSHGHYDHTGGLLGVLKHIGKRVPVMAHPEALNQNLRGGRSVSKRPASLFRFQSWRNQAAS